MEQLIRQIQQANDERIDAILQAVLKRFQALRPHAELCVLALRNNENRKQQLDEIITLLENMKSR